MIKKFLLKKIVISSCVLFALLLLYLIPKEKNKISVKEEVQYTLKEVKKHTIFLYDNNNYIAMTDVVITNSDPVLLAKELLNILISDGAGESKIPSGFKSVIPSDTKINNVMFEGDILKVDFSKELFDTKVEQEEDIISSIIYTLTSIKSVKRIMIYIDGTLLTKLPLSSSFIPSILDRSYGINKNYEFMSLDDITSLTTYYINEHNGDFYYVPVTSYVNDSREKISIIIDELATSHLYDRNLMSFLSGDARLLASTKTDGTLKLEFNDAIFSNISEQNILEEVIYTITLSVFDNYDVKEVIFIADNKEIYKKSIE